MWGCLTFLATQPHVLLHCRIHQRCHKVVHLFFGADVVCFVDDCLLLILGHGGVGVHSRLIHGQCHTEADGERCERCRWQMKRAERVAVVGTPQACNCRRRGCRVPQQDSRNFRLGFPVGALARMPALPTDPGTHYAFAVSAPGGAQARGRLRSAPPLCTPPRRIAGGAIQGFGAFFAFLMIDQAGIFRAGSIMLVGTPVPGCPKTPPHYHPACGHPRGVSLHA